MTTDKPISIKGKRLVITRPETETGRISYRLRSLGAEVINLPTIAFQPEPLPAGLLKELSESTFTHIFFTSKQAVKFFVSQINNEVLEAINRSVFVGAVGNGTKSELTAAGIRCDMVPAEQSAEGLVHAITAKKMEGARVLLPVSNIARVELQEGLEKLGVKVERVVIYKTIAPDRASLAEKIADINNKAADIYIFGSPSAFDNFITLMNIKNISDYFFRKRILATGKTTAGHISGFGIQEVYYPSRPGMESLVELLINKFSDIDDKELK